MHDDHGIYIYAKGSKYQGGFKNDKLDGWGKFESAEGTFIGEFKKEKKNGMGTLTFADGRKYQGSFKHDYFHGEGEMKFPHGAEYKGEWGRGTYHGKGTLKDPYQKHEGCWVNGVPHGEGKTTYTNGETFVGKFEKGEKATGIFTFHDGEVYAGQFADGKSHGLGKHLYLDGSSYDGNWREDEMHGTGKLTDRDGNVLEGKWINSKKNGEFTFTRLNGEKFSERYNNDILISREKVHAENSGSDKQIEVGQAHAQQSSAEAHIGQLGDLNAIRMGDQKGQMLTRQHHQQPMMMQTTLGTPESNGAAKNDATTPGESVAFKNETPPRIEKDDQFSAQLVASTAPIAAVKMNLPTGQEAVAHRREAADVGREIQPEKANGQDGILLAQEEGQGHPSVQENEQHQNLNGAGAEHGLVGSNAEVMPPQAADQEGDARLEEKIVAVSHPSNSVPIKHEDSEDESSEVGDCHFQLVISSKVTNLVIKVPRRRETSFKRLRREIDEEVTLPFRSFQFTLDAGGAIRLGPKQERNWRKWNVWEYLTKEGDGSSLKPHRIFIEEAPCTGKL